MIIDLLVASQLLGDAIELDAAPPDGLDHDLIVRKSDRCCDLFQKAQNWTSFKKL